MTMQAAVTEYLEREKAAHAAPGKVDLNAIAQDVAKRHQITERALWDAVLAHTMAGPC